MGKINPSVGILIEIKIFNLLLQGLCQLLESNVSVRCRQVDLKLVQATVPKAVASVKDKMPKINVQVTVDTERFLPADW